MIKKNYLILLIFSSLSLFSQQKFKQIKNDVYKVNEDCKIFYYYDDFKKSNYFKTKELIVSKSKSQYQSLSFVAYSIITSEKESRYYITFFSNKKNCIGKDSSVEILFKNGNILKLNNSTAKIECGTGSINVKLTDEIFQELTDENFYKIRLNFIDAVNDFEVDDKGNANFKNSLNCLSQIVI